MFETRMFPTGLETQTVSIESLTARLGAAQSQGVASLGFLSCLSLGAIVMLLHTLCPIWAAGLGQGERALLQKPKL